MSSSMSETYFGHERMNPPTHPMGSFRGMSLDVGESNDVEMIVGNPRANPAQVVSSLPYNFSNMMKRKRQRQFILEESSLDDLAERHGYTKIKIPITTVPLASYRRGVCRLNFWLTTGNVGSYLDHPTRGKHLLVRRDIDLSDAESVFENPMHHIARDYRRTTN